MSLINPIRKTIQLGLIAGLLSQVHAVELNQENLKAYQDAKRKIAQARAIERRDHPAKNIILFIGDGMSIPTMTASRIFEGQLRGETGEENNLAFEEFPHVALSKTYNVDAQVPDSAGTATAMLSGVKTRIGVVGVDETVPKGDCAAQKGHETATFLELAEAKGLSTGIVTTARLTHATPAATYAHAASRNWESDKYQSNVARKLGCADIARQFTEFSIGDGIDVAFGGGRRNFVPKEEADPESGKKGARKDGRNLIKEWQKRYEDQRAEYVWDQAGFAAIDVNQTDKVLGLFQGSHMQYEADRVDDKAGEPSVAEMTEKAIQLLSKNEKGYFLMVESGRIDHASHAGNAYRTLSDTVAYSDAVRKAAELTDEKDTLIIVTADHAHTLSIAGYPRRGNPILGLVVDAKGQMALADDGNPYTTLSFANGPGAVKTLPRKDLRKLDTQNKDFRQQSLVPVSSETHGGDDVAIFARGPRAFLINGLMEQNEIFHVMMDATDF